MAEPRKRPDRAGMKTMVTFLEPEVARQIKVIAAQTDRTVQDIGEEAIGEWLQRHTTGTGKRVAPYKKKAADEDDSISIHMKTPLGRARSTPEKK